MVVFRNEVQTLKNLLTTSNSFEELESKAKYLLEQNKDEDLKAEIINLSKETVKRIFSNNQEQHLVKHIEIKENKRYFANEIVHNSIYLQDTNLRKEYLIQRKKINNAKSFNSNTIDSLLAIGSFNGLKIYISSNKNNLFSLNFEDKPLVSEFSQEENIIRLCPKNNDWNLLFRMFRVEAMKWFYSVIDEVSQELLYKNAVDAYKEVSRNLKLFDFSKLNSIAIKFFEDELFSKSNGCESILEKFSEKQKSFNRSNIVLLGNVASVITFICQYPEVKMSITPIIDPLVKYFKNVIRTVMRRYIVGSPYYRFLKVAAITSVRDMTVENLDALRINKLKEANMSTETKSIDNISLFY